MFKTRELSFEGIVTMPDGSASSLPGVVICHPHPLFGGNMDNNVVLAVSFALVEQGFVTLRFNFRGVGNSQGEHSKGELEYQEALAALDMLGAWPGVNGRRLGLAGYSFGTGVILGNADLQKRARAIALISPSSRNLAHTPLKASKQPKLIITGDRDRLAPDPQLQSLLASFSHPPIFQVVAGADHYWVGQEDELSRQVSDFFLEHLK